ncbi:MAG: hypothetical protein WCG23_02070 [bacterium]
MSFIKTVKNTILAGIMLISSFGIVAANTKEANDFKIMPTSGLVPIMQQKPAAPKLKPLGGSPLPPKQKTNKDVKNSTIFKFFSTKEPQTPTNYPYAGKMPFKKSNSK